MLKQDQFLKVYIFIPETNSGVVMSRDDHVAEKSLHYNHFLFVIRVIYVIAVLVDIVDFLRGHTAYFYMIQNCKKLNLKCS
jgi:hypothetical protein